MNYNKKVIFPKVVVYKNLLKDVQEIFEIIQESESFTKKVHMFSPWEEWNANWAGMSSQINGARKASFLEIDDNAEKQKKFLNNVYEAFDFVVKDFFDDYGKDTDWPYYIKDLDVFNSELWSEAGISLLKYGKPLPPQTVSDMAMNYHTDTNQSDLESPGDKLAVTVTMYLNDNYDNGEISFYNSIDNKVYNYKPQAGDVTVFPSAAPYFHGVLPFEGSFRYLLRMFMKYKVNASDEWIKKLNQYGEDEFNKIEKERLQKSYLNGDHLIYINYDKNNPPHPKFKTIYVTEPPVWIK